MAFLLKGTNATLSEHQKTPKSLDNPFYEPLSLDEILDTEIKGWEKMSAHKLLVPLVTKMNAVVRKQDQQCAVCL